MKYWSISTTVRNPDRIPEFLRAAEPILGLPWTDETMVRYICELIRRRLYEPLDLSESQRALFEDFDTEMTLEEAQEIFESKNYVDPPMRGRTAIAPLRDLGLLVLFPHVQLTKLGEDLNLESISLQDVLINYNLKWEVPTPEHPSYKKGEGWNIKPFVGTLALIQRVNEKSVELGLNSVGLSREEFNVYVPTLIDFESIELFAQRVVDSRLARANAMGAAAKQSAMNSAIQNHLSSLPHGDGIVTERDLSNLADYGDNLIRYFRKTGYIEFRGEGRYVDISQTSLIQVALLIDNKLFTPVGYATADDYRSSISDVNSFIPPWATTSKLLEVKEYLRGVLQLEDSGYVVAQPSGMNPVNNIRGEDEEIVKLKAAIRGVKLERLKSQSRSIDFLSNLIAEYSELLKRDYSGYLPKPVALEFNAYKTFLSLNDAVGVNPNYPIGDDGEPLSTAPGGGTDLHCVYEDFELSVEVTMSSGRNQWVMEGQPVQRHLRDLENQSDKEVFGIFIAPRLYPDTVNTFWISNVISYEGRKQRIVPFDFETWTKLLELIKTRISNGSINRKWLRNLLAVSLPNEDEQSDSTLWLARIKSAEFLKQVSDF